MQEGFQDADMRCTICGQDFIWTAGEQAFICKLASEGRRNPDGSEVVVREPKRCPPCRKAKKDRIFRRANKQL